MANGAIVIGPSMQQIIATRYVLYGVDAQGNIQQYQNTPNDWLTAGTFGKQLVTDEYDLFSLDNAGNAYKFTGIANQWTQIGANLQFLAGGGKMLYALSAGTGTVMMYEGQPMGWTEIGGPVSSIAANGSHIVAISQDSGSILKYVPDPPEWQTIGPGYSNLFMAPNALYAVGSGQELFRYDGKPNVWVQVGKGWNRFSAVGVNLFAISADGSTVGEFEGVPGQWLPFSSDATGITDDEKFVYLTNAQSVRQVGPVSSEAKIDENPRPLEGEKDPEKAKAKAQILLTKDTDPSWAWSFQVANEAFAGYDGKITLTLRQGLKQQNLQLVRTHFERGNTYHFQMPVSSMFTGLDKLSVGGEDNFFGDQLHLGTVTAFDPAVSKVYSFAFNQKIPNDSWVTVDATVRNAHTAPGVATVFIWNFLGKDVAWGHASIELDDGTYISWWPNHVNRKDMPLLSDVYCSDAFPNRTFANDVAGEDGHPPDWRVAVGGLNHDKIRTWWAGFKTSHQWCTLSQNCSTSVADAIWAGGAASILTPRETANWENVLVWVPNDVLSFAQAIDAHLASK